MCHLGAGDLRDGESGQRGGWVVRGPGVQELISKVTTMAGVFNHSVCNNNELKKIQLEVLELDQALDLVRRNDTRYERHYCLVHEGSMLLVDVSLCSCMNGTRSLGSWLQLEVSFRRTHE